MLKLVWKCCTHSSILFICNIFCCWLILLSSLYIELALVCCTNPDNVHSLRTIFSNLNFVLPQSVPSLGTYSLRPIQKLLKCQTTTRNQKTAPRLWVREINWYQYTRGVLGRMKAKQRWFKVTRELCDDWFHHFRHHVHDGHWTGEFATVIWRLPCFTVSFRGDIRGESGPR